MNKKTTPRGIRNNNPLNIRIGNTWLGELQNPTDSEFEQFVEIRYGLRAGFCILRRYIRRYGRNTIAKIIRCWAPALENNTEMYIKFVANRLAMCPDDVLEYADEDTMCKLVAAMARYECGQEIAFDAIKAAYKLA